MISRRDFVWIALAGTGFAVLRVPRQLPKAALNTKHYEQVSIGDGLVVVEGWILRADEAAAVLA